jgi:hypothetical protein
MISREDRALVDVFMKAQAEPEGRIFSENILAGIKAAMRYRKQSTVMDAIEFGGALIAIAYLAGCAVGAICMWAVLAA